MLSFSLATPWPRKGRAVNPRFYFATCQIGAEKAVKTEVASALPGLRFAFSRPGFLTFKEDRDEAPALALEGAIFARLWGVVLGQAKDSLGLEDLLALIPPGQAVEAFDRDLYTPGDEAEGYVRHGHIQETLKGLAIPGLGSSPAPGRGVYSLIWVDDFHVFLTHHIHSARLLSAPGNIPVIPLPGHSPSRAYLKLEEAFCRFHPDLARGAKILELGCAPGGATTAMLDRGLEVTGVDPQFMDPRVLARPGFQGIRKQARYLVEDDLREVNPEGLVLDMSIPPADALAELSHVLSLLRAVWGPELRLRLGFLTLKLNNWALAGDIPGYLGRLERLGFQDLTPLQLASNRQEFFVWCPRFR